MDSVRQESRKSLTALLALSLSGTTALCFQGPSLLVPAPASQVRGLPLDTA